MDGWMDGWISRAKLDGDCTHKNGDIIGISWWDSVYKVNICYYILYIVILYIIIYIYEHVGTYVAEQWMVDYIHCLPLTFFYCNGSSFNRIYAKGPLIASCVRTLCFFLIMDKHRWHLVGKSWPYILWLVVDLPLWKICESQLGWLFHSQLNGKS